MSNHVKLKERDEKRFEQIYSCEYATHSSGVRRLTKRGKQLNWRLWESTPQEPNAQCKVRVILLVHLYIKWMERQDF